MKRQYQQLTYEQRCQIYTLKKTGLSQRAIARLISVNQSTISREIKRNSGACGYRFKQAHQKATDRRQATCQPTKMTPTLISFINSRLELEWAPEQISGWLRRNRGVYISHEAIYLHIWADKRAGGQLFNQLRRKGRKYEKRRHGKSTRGHIKGRVSIEQRPKIVDKKERVGDWEIDTVIGKNHKGALVTIVERSTLKLLCARVNTKNGRRSH